MRLIHYSDKEIESLENREYGQEELSSQAKPNGLWISVEGIEDENNCNWKEWCEAEGFNIENLAIAYKITLKEDAKIIYLKSHEEIFQFTKEYAYLRKQWNDPMVRDIRQSYELDWTKVKSEYQGIIISPYQWAARLAQESRWYYGWDCSSGCIWDLRCIKEFLPQEVYT